MMNLVPPVDMAELSIGSILPSLVLLVGALVLLLANVFVRAFDVAFRGVNIALCVLFLAISVLCSVHLVLGEAFFALIYISGLTILSQVTMELAAMAFVVLCVSGRDDVASLIKVREFYPLLLLMVAGFDIMVSSQHLLIVLLGLEIGSLALVVLIALSGGSKAIEAGVKYFVLSVLASVLFLLGVVCWYFASATFDIYALQNTLAEGRYISAYTLMAGLICMIGAIGFKSSSVPFHTWMPDIYEGSNAIVAGIVSIIPKIAIFALAINVFSVFIHSGIAWVQEVLYIIVILSITLPNIAALLQTDIKRMLAFSSIAHSGFVLACILINTQISLNALYLYWILFVFSNIGAFGLLWFARANHSYEYRHFTALTHRVPWYGLLASVFFLSLAGIPPFGLFFGKIAVVMSAFSADYVYLGVIMMINSAIAVFYYLRIVIVMFLPCGVSSLPPASDFTYHANAISKTLVVLMGVLCCVSVALVQYVLDFLGIYIIGAY